MVYRCTTTTTSLLVYPIDLTVTISSYLLAKKLESCLTDKLVIEDIRSIRVYFK